MSGKTSYHGFNTYNPLEEWDYNPDFSKLDERLELRGSNADRPSSAPDGAKYSVTNSDDSDYGARYVYDSGSSSWVKQPLDTPTLKAPSSGPVEVRDSDLVAKGNWIEGTGNGIRLTGTTGRVRGATDSNQDLEIQTYDGSSFLTNINISGGGPVGVRNADLDVNGNAISSNGNRVVDPSGGYHSTLTGGSNDGISLYDSANFNHLLVANEGGKVEIPNGNLSVGNNSITNVNQIRTDSSRAYGSWRVTAQGQANRIYDDYNSMNIALFKEGGNVEIPNGQIVAGGGMEVAGDVTIPNGDVFKYKITNTDYTMRVTTGGGEFRMVPYDNSSGSFLWGQRMHYDPGVPEWKVRTRLHLEGLLRMNGTQEIKWDDNDGDGNHPRIYVDSNGDIVAEDDAGNPTTLT